MHGFEPRKIALQHPRMKATREMPPKPKLFFTKERKKETSLKCEGSAHYSIEYNETPCEALPTRLSQLQTNIII